MKKESLITISKRTGFSVSTVSRVLSGKGNANRISEKTVAIIKEEAQKCNYTPSLLAKGLRTSRTNTIGLLVPGIENPYFANIASIVMAEARKSGYSIVMMDTMESEDNERQGIEALLARMVDGIIVVPSSREPSFLENINETRKPVVLIDRHFEQTTLSYASSDNHKGGFDATKYLIDFGHKDILCIKGIPHSMPAKERERGYLNALKQSGIESMARIAGGDFSIHNGYLETKLALESEGRPTAIFAMSNTILLGALKAIKEAGLRIPEDISVVSFDNYTYLDFLDPAITRIGQQINDMGTLAVKLLARKIAGEAVEETRLQVAPQLIVRNSVKRV